MSEARTRTQAQEVEVSESEPHVPTPCSLPAGSAAGPKSQASCIIQEPTSGLLPAGPAQSSQPGKLLLTVAFGSLLRRGFPTAPGNDFKALGTESLGELQMNFHIFTRDVPFALWTWPLLAFNAFQGWHVLAPSSCPTRRPSPSPSAEQAGSACPCPLPPIPDFKQGLKGLSLTQPGSFVLRGFGLLNTNPTNQRVGTHHL